MYETPAEVASLQALLDRSYDAAGTHLREVIGPERRVGSLDLCRVLTGMRLLVTATTTATGRPVTAPADGYFLHGEWHFSLGADSWRARHLAARPAVSVTHLPGEELAVVVHGRAEAYPLDDPDRPQLRDAMLAYYLPRRGPAFEEWLDGADAVAFRVVPERMSTFRAGG